MSQLDFDDPPPPHVSPLVWQHFRNPRNAGCLAGADGEGWAGSVASRRFMQIQIRMSGDRIEAAAFGTYGCMPAIACGSYITEWACGRALDEIFSCSPRAVRKALGGLPTARAYCADLAVEALQAAVHDALDRRHVEEADG